jgi:hypothetical protein
MNNMVINSEKTKAMYFQLNKIQDCIEPDITFKKVKINYTWQFRFLDINIDNKLKWNIHIQSVKNLVRCVRSLKVTESVSVTVMEFYA